MKLTIIRRVIITATNSRLSNSLFINLNKVRDNVSVKICDDCDGSCVKKTYK